MTKLREPLTYQHTLTKVAALIGWDQCGAICGVSERAARNWSDHDCATHIRMIDTERLDRAFMDAGGDCAPFHRLLGTRLDIAGHGGAAVQLEQATAVAAKESGEAIAALVLAGLPGSGSEQRRAARREGEQAIDALQCGLAVLDRLEAEGE